MRHPMIRVSTPLRLRVGLSVLCALLLVPLAAPALASGQNGPGRDGKLNALSLMTMTSTGDAPYLINVISSIATYRTYEEAEREAEEAYWRFESSTPVPAGGETAGAAYLASCRAEHAGDKKAMLEYLTGAPHDLYAHPSLTIERGATIWKGGSALDFEKIEVLGGETDGEWARLDVRVLRKGKVVRETWK